MPYRDSKLTQLIKNSLGGNSMTSIICTISPNKEHIPMTLSTLDFAKRAKNIKNNAKINEVIDDYDTIKKLQSVKIQRLSEILKLNFIANQTSWKT